MKPYCYNKSAIAIVHNPNQHDKTKHTEIDRHFIKEIRRSSMHVIHFVQAAIGRCADKKT